MLECVRVIFNITSCEFNCIALFGQRFLQEWAYLLMVLKLCVRNVLRSVLQFLRSKSPQIYYITPSIIDYNKLSKQFIEIRRYDNGC